MSLNQIIETYGLDKLNSATKYPSILTYHNLGEKGSLLGTLVEDKDFWLEDTCYITEKIDGTNARIILYDNDYIIGSREELLYAQYDRITNPQLGIVDTVRNLIGEAVLSSNFSLRVIYGEVYGGNVSGASKQYTTNKSLGFRVFDMAEIPMSILEETPDKISSWREHQGQLFANVTQMKTFAGRCGLKTVPYITTILGREIPRGRKHIFEFLQQFAETKAGIDVSGKAEGIVVRNFDRSLIRKMRFEDYERTAKRENWEI